MTTQNRPKKKKKKPNTFVRKITLYTIRTRPYRAECVFSRQRRTLLRPCMTKRLSVFFGDQIHYKNRHKTSLFSYTIIEISIIWKTHYGPRVQVGRQEVHTSIRPGMSQTSLLLGIVHTHRCTTTHTKSAIKTQNPCTTHTAYGGVYCYVPK